MPIQPKTSNILPKIYQKLATTLRGRQGTKPLVVLERAIEKGKGEIMQLEADILKAQSDQTTLAKELAVRRLASVLNA